MSKKTKHELRRTPLAFAGVAVLSVALLSGCGFGVDTTTDSRAGSATATTGMALAVQADVEADVAAFEYLIERTSCAGEEFEPFLYTKTVDLEGDLELPGGIGAWENAPYDADSGHAFADHFAVLEAGCYDVTATPLDASGAPTGACYAASQQAVEVLDGQTTEILLISQCAGAETGGLDTVASLNTAPTLTALLYTPSKFVNACVEVELCATASDPDGDPLDFVWTASGGLAPTVLSHTANGDAVSECVSVSAEAAGSYSFDLAVYDEVLDEQGYPMHTEDLTGEASHDTLNFPLYVSDDTSACAGEDEDDGASCQPITCDDVRAGSTIEGGEATLVVPEGACPIEVSVTSYSLTTGQIRPWDTQVMYDNKTADYGPGTHTIQIDVPQCAYQTDIYCGPAVCMSSGEIQGDELLDADVWFGPACGELAPTCI